MTPNENAKLDELNIIVDGKRSRLPDRIFLEHGPAAQQYLTYPTPKKGEEKRAEQDVVSVVAKCTCTEVETALTWVKSALRGTNLVIDFRFEDSTEFVAECKNTGTLAARSYGICIGLGCVPIFVGITNRLRHVLLHGPLLLEAEMQGHIPMLADKWDPEHNPVGTLMYDWIDEPNTTTSTVDTMLLLFFHEIAHAVRGHFCVSRPVDFTPEAYRRALESDADWCAGYMFMKYEIENLKQSGKLDQNSPDALCSRLAVAAASLNCALQVEGNLESKAYHLPYNRTMDNLFGAAVAWHEFGLKASFDDRINDAIGRLIVVDKILAHRLAQWVRYDDPRNEVDQQERRTSTETITQAFHEEALKWERGPVVGARALRANFADASQFE